MTIMLVRVGADASGGGGQWNGPVDHVTGRFVYVPIPETKAVHAGLAKPYASVVPHLAAMGVALPPHLAERNMHLDPDFDHLTYGDQGQRAKQLESLGPGDWIMFYAGLSRTDGVGLSYALIGMLEVARLARASELADLDCNAHTRRMLADGADDLVVIGRRGASGRFETALRIGSYRDGAYRVTRELLEAWGGLSVNDGYIQRSARLPLILQPERFRAWLLDKAPRLIASNWGHA